MLKDLFLVSFLLHFCFFSINALEQPLAEQLLSCRQQKRALLNSYHTQEIMALINQLQQFISQNKHRQQKATGAAECQIIELHNTILEMMNFEDKQKLKDLAKKEHGIKRLLTFKNFPDELKTSSNELFLI